MSIIDKFLNSKEATNDLARNSTLLKEMDDLTVRKMQDTLFEMYHDVKPVCDKYNISLYLIGGSALGAVRHHGFIPWDDDMDLAMTRSDYERFKSFFEEELGEKYILNAPNYSEKPCHKYPRVLKKDSYYRAIIDSDREDLHCIFLDLFIIENTPDSAALRKLKGTYCNFLYIMSWEVFIWENRNKEVKEFLMSGGAYNYYIRVVIGFLFSFKSSAKWFNIFDKAIQHNNNDTKYCCLATGRKRYFGEVFKRDQFFPGVKEIFEGEQVLLFQDLDNYLKNLYGDYMKIPPAEKRERHNVCEVYFSMAEMAEKRKTR